MEVAGPLGTPLGLAQRKRASPREKMVGKSDLVRAILDMVIKEKALSIYPGFSEGAVDKPQRMGEWSASQKNASWV